MTIYYVDPEAGSDAAAGTSFATRKRTITSANTSASNGDEIRIIASADPTSIGSATWTDGQNNLRIPSGLFVDADKCESGWTASSNVTVTYSTTRKQGNYSLSCAIGAGFTTGKIAYKYISAGIDPATMYQLSLWLQQKAGTLAQAGDITICLCSDNTGDTPAYSFNLGAVGALSTWFPQTINNGSAMTTTCYSIGIYVNVDRGAQTFLFDNLILCKNPTAADSISLTSLVSKNSNNSGTEPWLPIQALSGTILFFDCGHTSSPANTTAGQYLGATETVTTYKRETVKVDQHTSTTNAAFGAFSKNLTISGGWNRTDMSTQTGKTFLDGQNSFGYGLYQNGYTTTTLSDLSLVRFYYGLYFPNAISTSQITANIDHITACYQGANVSLSIGSTLTMVSLSNCYNQLLSSSGTFTGSTVTAAYVAGSVSAGTSISVPSTRSIFSFSKFGYCGSTLLSLNGQENNVSIDTLRFSSGNTALVFSSGCFNNKITITTEATLTGSARFISDGGFGSVVDVTGCAISVASPSYIIYTSTDLTTIGGTWNIAPSPSPQVQNVVMLSPTFTTGTPYTYGVGYGQIVVQNYNGSSTDHRIYSGFGLIQSDTTTAHGSAAFGWKIAAKAPFKSFDLPVGQIAVAAGSPVTATIWVQADDASIVHRFMAVGGNGTPLNSSAFVFGDMTTVGSWYQLTLTFTPDRSGVVQLTASCSSNSTTTHYGWFSDLGVSQ